MRRDCGPQVTVAIETGISATKWFGHKAQNQITVLRSVTARPAILVAIVTSRLYRSLSRKRQGSQMSWLAGENYDGYKWHVCVCVCVFVYVPQGGTIERK